MTDVQITTPAEDTTSLGYQQRFAAALPQAIIGRPLNELDIDRLAGSSGCSKGFMNALAPIKTDAQFQARKEAAGAPECSSCGTARRSLPQPKPSTKTRLRPTFMAGPMRRTATIHRKRSFSVTSVLNEWQARRVSRTGTDNRYELEPSCVGQLGSRKAEQPHAR